MLSLFLPERCLHCASPSECSVGPRDLPRLSRYLCEVCHRIIERTDAPSERTLREQFQMIAPDLHVESCGAAFLFLAESPVKSIVHAMKYSGMPRLAEELGRSIAYHLPKRVDYIIPVPLHRTRLAERGYNQAEALAKGLAADSKIPVLIAAKRSRPTPTQTNLSIPERIENVRGAFVLTKRSVHVRGKHVLIVDDVMTTGSTLASLAETVLEAKPAAISILALAMADRTA